VKKSEPQLNQRASSLLGKMVAAWACAYEGVGEQRRQERQNLESEWSGTTCTDFHIGPPHWPPPFRSARPTGSQATTRASDETLRILSEQHRFAGFASAQANVSPVGPVSDRADRAIVWSDKAGRAASHARRRYFEKNGSPVFLTGHCSFPPVGVKASRSATDQVASFISSFERLARPNRWAGPSS
jgi:hypothetical protein